MTDMTVRLLYNAKIYTFDPKTPYASALEIEYHHGDGRILAIGDDDTILSEFDGEVNKYNCDGRTVIPGLIDAHIHLEQFALSLGKIDCEVPTKQECLDRIADRARDIPPGKWILGHGWNQNNWENGFGSAVDLDRVAPNNPVYLTSKSLHSSWVNSIALKIAGINESTPDPQDGAIQRNSGGFPTGIFHEYASKLVNKFIPESSQKDMIDAIAKAQIKLLDLGITSIHDFDRRECFSALQSLHLNNGLKLRVIKSIPLESLPQAIDLGLQSGFGDDWLRIGSVKMFSDGALGPQTAAMFQPFEPSPNNHGMLLMDAEEIYEHGQEAVKNRLSLAIHAIGDKANHEVLNAFQQLRQIDPNLRHRIEHVQILHPDDIHRLKQLGIIASMQPIHATSDMQMADRQLGDRAAFTYALRSLDSQGTRMAFGSDAPVESPNPFWGVHAAVTRRRGDGSPGLDGWYPKERLTVEEALSGFTKGAAYAAGMEDRQGMLSPGHFADLLLLDTEIFKCDSTEIRNIRPVATMVAGEWVSDTP
jgi:predicted amidohydrolase YtcJ